MGYRVGAGFGDGVFGMMRVVNSSNSVSTALSRWPWIAIAMTLLCTAALGCSGKTDPVLTQTMIWVDADPEVRQWASAVEIVVAREEQDGFVNVASKSVAFLDDDAVASRWPILVPVEPASGAERFKVSAIATATGGRSLEAFVIAGYVPHSKRQAYLYLTSECEGAAACPDTETCVFGECESATIRPENLQQFNANNGGLGQWWVRSDAGVVDAGVDASLDAGASVDSGVDASVVVDWDAGDYLADAGSVRIADADCPNLPLDPPATAPACPAGDDVTLSIDVTLAPSLPIDPKSLQKDGVGRVVVWLFASADLGVAPIDVLATAEDFNLGAGATEPAHFERSGLPPAPYWVFAYLSDAPGAAMSYLARLGDAVTAVPAFVRACESTTLEVVLSHRMVSVMGTVVANGSLRTDGGPISGVLRLGSKSAPSGEDGTEYYSLIGADVSVLVSYHMIPSLSAGGPVGGRLLVAPSPFYFYGHLDVSSGDGVAIESGDLLFSDPAGTQAICLNPAVESHVASFVLNQRVE